MTLAMVAMMTMSMSAQTAHQVKGQKTDATKQGQSTSSEKMDQKHKIVRFDPQMAAQLKSGKKGDKAQCKNGKKSKEIKKGQQVQGRMKKRPIGPVRTEQKRQHAHQHMMQGHQSMSRHSQPMHRHGHQCCVVHHVHHFVHHM